jgi:hypothetical protein
MSTSYGGTPPGITGTHYGGADIGILGSEVPTEGLDGPGYLVGGNPAARLRGPITRWPAGALVVYESSAFEYVGATDYALYHLYEDGVASTTDIGYGPGIGRIELGVGLGGGVLSGGGQLDDAASAGALTGGGASELSGGVSLAAVTAAGALGGGATLEPSPHFTVRAKLRSYVARPRRD